MSAPLTTPLSAASDACPLMGPQGPIGVLICGHGSRNRLAVAEFADLAQQLRQHLGNVPLEYGYLEFARPILRDGLERLRHQGVRHVLAIPAMLFAAGHAKNDIPSVLNAYAAETGLRIDYGRELGVDRSMILAAGGRIRSCLDQADAEDRAATRDSIPLHDTLLVVVGRGSSDPDANSNVAKVTRMLVEGFGFGWGETCYSGVTFPLVEPGLRQIVRLGYRRVVVFPYFLFSGVLVSRIVEHTQRVAADHPEIDFRSASYLGDHPGVLDTFRERVLDVLRGETAMNCSLCKYRAQVLGFEQEVGLPQQSHHHHVEGLMESCTLCERECTGACQPDGVPLPLGRHSNDRAAATSEPLQLPSHGHPHGQHHPRSQADSQSQGSGPEPGVGHQQHHDPHLVAHNVAHQAQPHAHNHGPDHGGAAAGSVPQPEWERPHSHSHSHSHSHEHSHRHGHDHPSDAGDPAHSHHHPYPHADHPLGPRTLRGRSARNTASESADDESPSDDSAGPDSPPGGSPRHDAGTELGASCGDGAGDQPKDRM